ncbi:MAG: polysaccharide deacetylase family protein [Actinomycetota bacterium]
MEPGDDTADTRGDRAVFLTFDDGPDPVWTPRVIAALAAACARATFHEKAVFVKPTWRL